VTFAVVAEGLWIQTVVYQYEGDTPGLDPADGRKTSVPEKPAKVGGAVSKMRAVTTVKPCTRPRDMETSSSGASHRAPPRRRKPPLCV
jgi:hypothetical protein